MASALFDCRQDKHGPLKARRPVRRAALFVGGVGLLYIITSAVLAVAGAVPTAPVFFGLDVGNYYFWQMVFVLPLFLAVWLIASGLLRLAGKKEAAGNVTLAEAAWAWGWPLIVAWIPSAVEAVFMGLGMAQGEWVSLLSRPGVWQTTYFVFYAGAVGLAFRDFIIAARKVQKKWGAGVVLTGLAAAVAAIGAYIAFIR